MKRNRTQISPIQLFPATLLSRQQAWADIARTLPVGAYLLVSGKTQNASWPVILHYLRRRGRTVKTVHISQE